MPLAKRLAYLPRTPALNSYSARIPSSAGSTGAALGWLLGFFIDSTFAPRRQTGSDKAYTSASFKVNHNEHAGDQRASDQNVARLADRMVRVADGNRQRIGERRGRFLESDAMLQGIGGGLLGIPLERKTHPVILPRHS